jgi:precorrin-8X/cobalt-precorrin-8 methylmutase
MTYNKDPDDIYKKSFEIIRLEANLDVFSPSIACVVERMIHACGMVDIVQDIHYSPNAALSGRAALLAGKPVFCDVEMVRNGIISRFLPNKNELICLINDETVANHAKSVSTTRSAAQVDFWADKLSGSIVCIGNAPTALFRLLELIDKGADKPALILGFPVGFVGAQESKQALHENTQNLDYMTLKGRRGGSAMASAALNAVSISWE